MASLDVKGEFWLARNPEKRVAGHLVADTARSASLDLIGSFGDFGTADDDAKPVRILGTADGKTLTLDECLRTHSSLTGNSYREEYSSPVVFSGIHLESSEVARFDSIKIKLKHLHHWVWKSDIRMNYEFSDDLRDIKQWNLTYSPSERMIAKSHLGDVELGFSFKFPGEFLGSRVVEEDCLLIARFLTPTDIRDIFGVCSDFQDIVTLGVGEPSFVDEVTLRKEDVEGEIELFTRWRSAGDDAAGRTVYPPGMIFTYDDIGGVQGIADWLGKAGKFRPVIGSLRAAWYTPTLDVEQLFLNHVIAAEALDRIVSEKKKGTLKTRLQRLAETAGFIEEVFGDSEAFADAIVDLRTEYVHHTSVHGGDEEDADTARMFYLGEAVYLVVVMCLVNEGGLPEQAQANIRKHWRFRRMTEYFAEV